MRQPRLSEAALEGLREAFVADYRARWWSRLDSAEVLYLATSEKADRYTRGPGVRSVGGMPIADFRRLRRAWRHRVYRAELSAAAGRLPGRGHQGVDVDEGSDCRRCGGDGCGACKWSGKTVIAVT